MLLGRKPLVAEHDDAMLEMRLPDLCERPVRPQPREIDVGNLGEERLSKPPHLHRPRIHPCRAAFSRRSGSGTSSRAAPATCLLYVDRHIVHDGGFHAFADLAKRGLKVRRPQSTFGTPDHYVPTSAAIPPTRRRRKSAAWSRPSSENVKQHGIPHFLLGDARQGIVHVVGPEQGMTQPGMVLVCGDSHTSTHGALGALAFGIGAVRERARAGDADAVAGAAEDHAHPRRGPLGRPA